VRIGLEWIECSKGSVSAAEPQCARWALAGTTNSRPHSILHSASVPSRSALVL